MKDEFLAKLGLQTLTPHSSILIPTISMFGVGVLVGAGIGLMLAPKAGNELRGEVERKVNKLWQASKRKMKATPLEELDRDEIYARAEKANIPGRATMSKTDLIDALEGTGV